MASPVNMERASKLIRGLRLPGDTITLEELACAAWTDAVGKKISSHSRAVRMVRGRLVVEVEDSTWQRQLFTLSPYILANLEKSLGRGAVNDLEFRVMPRRLDPQRAVQALPGMAPDEAAGIEDPVMRSIYRLAKKRAGA
jgi:hypothetical protein